MFILKAHMDAIPQFKCYRCESSDLRFQQMKLDENLIAMEAMKIDTEVNYF